MTTKPRLAATVLSLAVACTPTGEAPMIENDESDGSDDSDDGETEEPSPSCPEPTDGPTMAADITDDTTWTAAGSPYVIDHGISIRATLTLEPCTEVLIGADITVTVRDAGGIVGIGTQDEPIRIGAVDPDDPWATIHVYHGNPIVLAHATIEDGGDLGAVAPTEGAMIFAQAVDAQSSETLDFDHVTLRGSASQAIRLMDGARFSSDSSALVVTDNRSYPVNMWANGLSTLPEGDYTGNDRDAIFVVGGGAAAVQEDVTLRDRGVPYVVGDEDSGTGTQLRVVGAALTIEPGVELRFGPGGGLHVDYGTYAGIGRGALVAVGTAEAPIVFTSSSATPAAGDWYGVYFWNQPDPRDVISYARVEFAGGVSQIGSSACTTDNIGIHDAAIRFLGTGGQLVPDSPSEQIVTYTEIVASAGSGIDRGWVGEPIEFLDTNTFVDVAQCEQSYPRPPSPGTCPDPAPCP
ncbi:MAG TPA: hypothetical protein VFG69_02115 [Nannocystaceae bacterium]|nr:hypothetical protein [Nannocystaceae bacterium]